MLPDYDSMDYSMGLVDSMEHNMDYSNTDKDYNMVYIHNQNLNRIHSVHHGDESHYDNHGDNHDDRSYCYDSVVLLHKVLTTGLKHQLVRIYESLSIFGCNSGY
jgi:hypothetical protein